MTSAGIERVPDLLRMEAILGTGPVELSTARVMGTMITAIYRPNWVEWRRRGRDDDPALRRMSVLDALLAVPLGVPIDRSALSARVSRALRQVTKRSVAWADDSVTRLVTVPLEPELVVVRGHQWNSGLRRASAFSTYCRRLVLWTGRTDQLSAIAAEADFYGVGLAIPSEFGLALVVAPAPAKDSATTPASWWLAEELFAQSNRRHGLPGVK